MKLAARKITAIATFLLAFPSLTGVTRDLSLPSEREMASLGCTRYEPLHCDYLFMGGMGLVALYPNTFPEKVGPAQARWSEPSPLDVAARDLMVWDTSRMADAALTSDIMISTLASSLLWAPLLTSNDYYRSVLMGVEAVLYTATLTEIIKRTAGRQRPYAHYGTWPTNGVNDNLSFFSGHTSTAFALATTSALMISQAHPEWAWWIYPSFYLTAATVGYMRIAADKHYLTDVLVGAAVGTAISWLVFQWRRPWFIVAPTAEGGAIRMRTNF